MTGSKSIQIIYEDNHLLVLNKRTGDLIQGDKTGDTPLSEMAKQYIKEKYDKPGNVYLGIPHRLDRPTSGLIVFTKTSKALSRLNKLFSSRDITKIYWAIVQNAPEKTSGTLRHYLARNRRQNKSYSHDKEVKDSKVGILHYNVKKELDRYYLLEINLETGRHHQIRSQLAKIGSIIKGDLKYGADRSNPDGGIHLHARALHFVHPITKEELKLIAAPPNDPLWNACV
ncbi:MAG TPA: RNA pseudouridine synthase [Flavobacteriaceae bacterium]|nr:RNA pseudouridine synthase [Flavobacteriaceae bacterium]